MTDPIKLAEIIKACEFIGEHWTGDDGHLLTEAAALLRTMNPPEGCVRLPDGRDVKVSMLGMGILLDMADGKSVGSWLTPRPAAEAARSNALKGKDRVK